MAFSFFPVKRVVDYMLGVDEDGTAMMVITLECKHRLMYRLNDPLRGNHSEEHVRQLKEQGCLLCRVAELENEYGRKPEETR